MTISRIFFFFTLILGFAVSCDTPLKNKVSHTEQLADKQLDNHSYANMHKIKTKHLHLDLDVDFDKKSIYGVARHTMKNLGTDTAIFDIKGLNIRKVTIGEKDEIETDFLIGQWDKDSIFGQPLLVKITPQTTQVNIYYQTTELTEAIDWLSPEQTTGKKLPYMYTQGQAILTRSWIPLQDSPANRITYSADVKVPENLMAVMSASNPTVKQKDGKYHFEMNQAIPCYLIALAVGDLTYRKLGEKCGVYAEPEMIGQCAYEFVDLPKMIGAAQDLYGPYRWEQYDLIVLPYSFPFGGMENPRLTFVNPTILTGDRTLVSLIAHELAHSWSGNLVTNASWDDFWMNEGFTVYFENRIMESLYGKEIADILALIEFQELEDEIVTIQKSLHPEDTKLKLNLKNRNPDEGLTDIAYVKGAFFLKTLEKQVGRVKIDAFLKNYFSSYSFQTITTEQFIEHLNKELLDPNRIKFNTDEWVYGSGIPDNCIKIRSQRFKEVQQLAARLVAGEDIFKKKIRYVKVKNRRKKKREVIQLTRDQYITQEWLAFIRTLPKNANHEMLRKIDRHLNFKNCGNSEIMAEWYVLGIEAGYQDIKSPMARFLHKVGRRKFLMPIYTALSKNESDRNWALGVFETAKDAYHYVSRSSVESILINN